jgi:hypothetical protein
VRRNRLPAHLRRNPLLTRLRREANGLRGLYGVPVLLAGSALLDANSDPRDWDIRLTIEDDDFRRRYGDPEQWHRDGASGNWTRVRWRWSDDCVRRSKNLSAALGVLVDFQVYPRSYVKRIGYNREPVMRLDTRKGRKQ